MAQSKYLIEFGTAEKAILDFLNSENLTTDPTQLLLLINNFRIKFRNAVENIGDVSSLFDLVARLKKTIVQISTSFNEHTLLNSKPMLEFVKNHFDKIKLELLSFLAIDSVKRKLSKREMFFKSLTEISELLAKLLSSLQVISETASDTVKETEQSSVTSTVSAADEASALKDKALDKENAIGGNELSEYNTLKAFFKECASEEHKYSFEHIILKLRELLNSPLNVVGIREKHSKQENTTTQKTPIKEDLLENITSLVRQISTKVVEENKNISCEDACLFYLILNDLVQKFELNPKFDVNAVKKLKEICESLLENIRDHSAFEEAFLQPKAPSLPIISKTKTVKQDQGQAKNTEPDYLFPYPEILKRSIPELFKSYKVEGAKRKIGMHDLLNLIGRFSVSHDNFEEPDRSLWNEWGIITRDIKKQHKSTVILILKEITSRMDELNAKSLTRLCLHLSEATLLYRPLFLAIEQKVLSLMNKQPGEQDIEYIELSNLDHFCEFFMTMSCKNQLIIQGLINWTRIALQSICKQDKRTWRKDVDLDLIKSDVGRVGRIALTLSILSRKLDDKRKVQKYLYLPILDFTRNLLKHRILDNIPDEQRKDFRSGILTLNILLKDDIEFSVKDYYDKLLAPFNLLEIREKRWYENEARNTFVKRIQRCLKDEYGFEKGMATREQNDEALTCLLRSEHLIRPFHYDLVLVTDQCVYGIEANGRAYHFLVHITSDFEVCFDHLNGKSRFKKEWIEGGYLFVKNLLPEHDVIRSPNVHCKPLVSINIDQTIFEGLQPFTELEADFSTLFELQKKYLNNLMAEAYLQMIETAKMQQKVALARIKEGSCLNLCLCERNAEQHQLIEEDRVTFRQTEERERKEREERERIEIMRELKEHEDRVRIQAEVEQKQREEIARREKASALLIEEARATFEKMQAEFFKQWQAALREQHAHFLLQPQAYQLNFNIFGTPLVPQLMPMPLQTATSIPMSTALPATTVSPITHGVPQSPGAVSGTGQVLQHTPLMPALPVTGMMPAAAPFFTPSFNQLQAPPGFVNRVPRTETALPNASSQSIQKQALETESDLAIEDGEQQYSYLPPEA